MRRRQECENAHPEVAYDDDDEVTECCTKCSSFIKVVHNKNFKPSG